MAGLYLRSNTLGTTYNPSTDEPAMKTRANPIPHLDPTSSSGAFRRLALALPGAVEASHMGSPDFRIHNSIFATLAYGPRGWGTRKLTPEQQPGFLADLPNACIPAPGGWGRMGMTLIRLDASEDILRGALHTAYTNVIAKPAVARLRVPAATRKAQA